MHGNSAPGLAAAGRLRRGGRSLAATFVLDGTLPLPVRGVVQLGEPPVPGARRDATLALVERRRLCRADQRPPRGVQ